MFGASRRMNKRADGFEISNGTPDAGGIRSEEFGDGARRRPHGAGTGGRVSVGPQREENTPR